MCASKEHKLFSDVTDNFVGDDLEDIEVDGLGKRSALTNNNNITFLNWESRWAVDWNISVSLFVSVVLGDVMEIITSDDNGSLHFGWNTNSFQDLASDGDVGGERAFSVNELRLDGFFRCFES